MWEELLLPSRVKGYREQYLDVMLSEGAYFWRMEENGRICFERTDRIDWDEDTDIPWERLTKQEALLAEALKKRGASFAQSLSGALGGEPIYDTLLSLVEKGIVCADSCGPVRHVLKQEQLKNCLL